MTQQNVMIDCIRSRGDIGDPRVSLRKLLRENDMEDYIKLCANRILYENLIDHSAVTYRLNDPYDLLFNIEGMELCNDILKGYIVEDELLKCKKVLLKTEDALKLVQEEAKILRETPRQILSMIAKGNNVADISEETMSKMQLFAKEELKARRLSSTIHRKYISLLSKIRTLWHYRRLIYYIHFHPDIINEINSSSS